MTRHNRVSVLECTHSIVCGCKHRPGDRIYCWLCNDYQIVMTVYKEDQR